jgi:hypothetical protein
MQHLEVSCAVRPIYGSLGAKGLNLNNGAEYSFSLLCYFRTIICLIVNMTDSELSTSVCEAML